MEKESSWTQNQLDFTDEQWHELCVWHSIDLSTLLRVKLAKTMENPTVGDEAL